MKSRMRLPRQLFSAFLIPVAVLAGCSGLPSEEKQNLIGMCELLDDAYVEQGDFYSALAERSDLSRAEAEELFAQSVDLATAISNYSFGLQAAAIASEGDNSDLAQSADELVSLAWRVEEAIETRSGAQDAFLPYGISMRMALGDCEELGADIQTSVF
jgi:hypothetical protein